MELIKTIPLVDLIDLGDGHLSVVDDFSDVDGPLYGETLFYRMVWTRVVPYEDPINVPQIAMAVSIPSRPVLTTLIDTTNRQASKPEISILSHVTNSAKIKATINKLAHNCTYYLSYLTPAGTWARLEEVTSNDPIIEFEPSYDFVLKAESGGAIFYRFKVDVLNASGLINLEDRIATVNLNDLI